jgi:uncharacterized repeat protein (TIGR01451 family)
MVLLVCGVAAADTVTTTFEPTTFHPGPVDGQDGWKSAVPGDIPALPFGYDQEVVVNNGAPSEFGSQSLRHSNAYNEPTGEFHFQTYSKPTTVAAGETLANTEYTAQFSFISKTPAAQQPGLNVTVSPDSSEVGARMSYVGLRDMPNGVRVTVYDTPEPDGDFVAYDGGLLDRRVPHTVKFWIKLNPGPDNDLVRIYIDGQDLGQCFTTWENFYRVVPEPVPTINSLQFRSAGGEVPSLVGGGYLFDNVTTTTANGPGPAGCDTPVEKTADSPTVRAGGRAGYQITVRNRGRVAARNLRVCDHVPRRMRFVSGDRRLRHIGRQRCLMIRLLRPRERVSFHLVLQVDADTPPGMVPNIADIIHGTPGLPVGSEPGTPTAPGANVPRVIEKIKAIVRARAIVRVLKRLQAQRGRPRARPPFTG